MALTPVITEENIKKVSEFIGNSQKIVLITHISPDGDAMGAALAMYHYLTALHKDATVIVPNRYAEFLAWMPGSNQIIVFKEMDGKATNILKAADLLFAIDFNAAKRADRMSALFPALNCKKILIDHHRDPEHFCDVIISHPAITSTSELIYRLICRMDGFELITKACAECIYTGMMTDTGAFTFNSNYPEIYQIISELLSKGIDKDDIYNKVYNTYSADRIRLMGFTLSEKMEILPDYHTAIITLSQAELNWYNYQEGDTEGFVNIPLSIKGIVFSVLLKEIDSKEHESLIKLSLRSRGTFPVNEIASEYFNGGGHINAAGGECYTTMEEAVARLKSALPHFKQQLNELSK